MLKTNAGYKGTFFDEYIENNYIPKDHPLIKIKKFVNLDFLLPLVKDSYKNDTSVGRDPIDPRVLFMSLLLAYIENLSDIETARQLKIVPLYRYFVGLTAEDKIPDDTTLGFFRNNRMGEEKFKMAFEQIVKQLFAAGLIDGKIQSQDATSIRGNIAILDSFQLLNKCRENVLREVKKLDAKLYEEWKKKYDFKIIPNPKDKQKHFEALINVCQKLFRDILGHRKLLKNKRLHREITILNRAISERKDERFDSKGKKVRKENEKKITGKMINPSDPDASWGAKSETKFFAGYKASVNTDHAFGMITEIEVNKAGHPEEKSAAPMLERQKENLGIVPEHFTADAKYDAGNTRAEIKSLETKDNPINLYIPLARTKNKEGGYIPDDFLLEGNMLICPAGFCSEHTHADDNKMSFEFRFNSAICNACKFKSECTKSFAGRRILLSHTRLERAATVSFNASEQYQIVYKDQHWKVEPKNADLKRYQRLSRALYQGLSRINIQAYLAAIASNLKKYTKVITGKIEEGISATLIKLSTLSPPKGQLCPDSG